MTLHRQVAKQQQARSQGSTNTCQNGAWPRVDCNSTPVCVAAACVQQQRHRLIVIDWSPVSRSVDTSTAWMQRHPQRHPQRFSCFVFVRNGDWPVSLPHHALNAGWSTGQPWTLVTTTAIKSTSRRRQLRLLLLTLATTGRDHATLAAWSMAPDPCAHNLSPSSVRRQDKVTMVVLKHLDSGCH